MDSLITAAALALAAGDPLGALKRVALRQDPPALAVRGIAMAQLGDLGRAQALLRAAARAFGSREPVARARCVVAEAEIALVSRDLGWPAKALDAARATLAAHGDRLNAAHAGYLEVRRLLLIGRLDEAEHRLDGLDPAPFPAALRTAHELVVMGVAMRRLRTAAAHAALARAERAAALAGIGATGRGFALTPRRAAEVVVLARPVDEAHAAVLALLADGESWSSSGLALALGASQRTVQRAIDALGAAGKVQSFGRGRARRWLIPPVPGFTTTLLLPTPLPGD